MVLAKHVTEISAVLELLGMSATYGTLDAPAAGEEAAVAAAAAIAQPPVGSTVPALESVLAEMRRLALLRVGLSEDDVQSRIQVRGCFAVQTVESVRRSWVKESVAFAQSLEGSNSIFYFLRRVHSFSLSCSPTKQVCALKAHKPHVPCTI